MPTATLPAIEDTAKHIEWCIGIGTHQLPLTPEADAGNLQQEIFRMVAAGNLWRALAEQIGEKIMETDLRGFAKPLELLAKFSLKTCKATQAASKGRQGLKSLDELELTIHEMTRLLEWIETWPTIDPSNRDAVRNSDEPYLTKEELLAWGAEE